MPDIFDASEHNTPAKKIVEVDQPASEIDQAAPVIDHQHTEVQPQTAAPETAAPVADTSPSTDADDDFHRLTRHVDEYSEVMRAEEPSDNPFKSFVPKPEKISFDSQHYEEHILLMLRRHPLTQLGWMIIAALMALAPFLFIGVGLLNFLPPNYQLAALIGWYLLLTGFVLESFLVWFYHVFIITDERIIDVDFHNLLYRDISAAKIDRIEDVTTVTGGFLASMFNYGTVKIQTAGSAPEFQFEDVPQPAKVAAFLNEMILEEEREKIEGRAH